jgi:molybdenum-dependent DNA-binding transcriptional regulator ModE
MTTAPTYDELERCLDVAANLVTQFGDEYLPLFARLEKEQAKLAEDQASLDRLRARARLRPAAARA